MHDLIARQHRIRRRLDRDIGRRRGARQRPKRRDRRVLCGADEPYAGQCARLGSVGDAHTRMRVRRTQHHCVQRAGRRHVGDVAADAAQQRGVLLAGDRLIDPEFHERPWSS
jgi:hypothetical protein